MESQEERRTRVRHTRRRREHVRPAIEIGAFAVLAVVFLAMVAVVLGVGKSESKPPASTLLISQSADFQTLDPALATTREAWELEYATCAKLLDYPARGGYLGTKVVPEVARAFPARSADGRTYAFRLRRGWRFSDGSRVTAAAFARAFERARSTALVSPAAPYLRSAPVPP